jgi:hypothetical protein
VELGFILKNSEMIIFFGSSFNVAFLISNAKPFVFLVFIKQLM